MMKLRKTAFGNMAHLLRGKGGRCAPGPATARTALSVALTACGLVATLAATSVHAQFQNRTFRVGTTATKQHSTNDGYVAMHACMQEKSGGKMRLRVFWDGVLGSLNGLVQSVRTGSVDMTTPPATLLAGFAPVFGILDMPYLFNTVEEADQFFDGKVGDWFANQLSDSGIVGLGYWEIGFRHITNSVRPITKLEDLSGIKIRVIQSAVFLDTFKALGSNAVPMDYTEVYSGLETGTIDAQENPFSNIMDMKFYEVQKYLTLSGHAYGVLPVTFSKKTWDGLSAQEQTVLRECTAVGAAAQRKSNRIQDAQGIEKMRAEGLLVSELDPGEVARIRARTEPIYERYADTVGKDALAMVRAELQRIRGE